MGTTGGLRLGRLGWILAVSALLLGAPVQSRGAALTSGSISINLLGNMFSFPAGAGVTGTATSDSNATLAAGNAFSAFLTTTFVANSTQPVSAIYVYVNNNQAGSFVGAPPGGGALFTGMATVFVGGVSLAVIPLAVGAPTTVHVTKQNAMGGCFFCLTGIGANWTAGTAVITNVATKLGGTLHNVTVMGNNGLNASGGGTLTLVSPGKVITNLTGPIPLVSTLTLTYTGVPEAGAPLLLGVGGTLLLFFRRRLLG